MKAIRNLFDELSVSLIDKYAIWAQFESASEAEFDGRLYAIRKTLDGAWEAVYMPSTPVEKHLGLGTTRPELAADIAAHINYQRYELQLAGPVTAGEIVDAIILLLAQLTVVGVTAKQATQLGGVIANHEIGPTVGMWFEQQHEAEFPVDERERTHLASEAYGSDDNSVPEPLHYCDGGCGRSNRESFLREVSGGWMCDDCLKSHE